MRPEQSASPEEDAFNKALILRASFHRRAMIVVAVWILAWAALVAENVISNTQAYGGWMSVVWLGLIVSPFVTVFLLMLAAIGRVLGNLQFLKSYRYHLTMACPTMVITVMLGNSLLVRLQPERRFEKLFEAPLPKALNVIGYESICVGMDSTVEFHLRGDDQALDELIEVLDFSKKSGRGDEIYSEDWSGSMVTLELDRTDDSAMLRVTRY